MKKEAFRVWTVLPFFIAISFGAYAADKASSDDCLACHSDSTLTKQVNGKPVSLYVSPQKFAASIHGSMFSCVDCHSDIKGSMHESTPAKVNCGSCHNDEAKQLANSLHGRAAARGDPLAPRCVNCHGNH